MLRKGNKVRQPKVFAVEQIICFLGLIIVVGFTRVMRIPGVHGLNAIAE